jgi:calcium-translocating P-type ATPase
VKTALAGIAVRPRLAHGLAELISACRQNKVALKVVAAPGSHVAVDIAERAGLSITHKDPLALIVELQSQGERVGCVSDGAHGAEPFAQCDLAIGITSGHGARFSARADILAYDLTGVRSVIEAGAAASDAKRDAVGLSVIANAIGAAMCVRGATGIVAASRAVHLATLASYADSALRFRGGERMMAYTDRFADPRPELRWGKPSVSEVLKELDVTPDGITSINAQERLQARSYADHPKHEKGSAFLQAVGAQLRSPLIGLMAGGAALTFLVGTPVEFGLVTLTILVNVLFGAWQEQQVQGASKALKEISPNMTTVIRDGIPKILSSRDLVPGDMIILAPGDRIPADCRVVESESLEVDEAHLTGESMPAPKSPNAMPLAGRILLEGSDVIVGRATAVVVAVGRHTRMGTIAAAIAQDERSKSPLNTRLAVLLKQFLPIAASAGAIVFVAGLAQGRHWRPELVLATTLALSAIPEGLPLLAGVAEVAVSSRLSKRGARLRKLGAAEALGRVDVACTDKTGTLTQGKLVLAAVASAERLAFVDSLGDGAPPSNSVREIVLAAALASPHPDSSNVRAHPTDMAVLSGAANLDLSAEIRADREEEAPFEPMQAFHASRVAGRVVVKGAPEEIAERCTHIRTEHGDVPVAEFEPDWILQEADRIAARGMRVLMVAEGPHLEPVDDPKHLIALGFLGIRDPLRENAKEAVARCQRAGVRVIMLTGDHPTTARAIARETGLDASDANVLTGSELVAMKNEELDRRLAHVTVVARVTPLDKVRIVESLQRMGHVVAMTGDGVNDAPALRLSDVGIAMGLGGTEVARQAADVVLADDDFTTLVEALVEGRAFWRNIRRTLGLLLGGILGELGLVALATASGLPSPLTTRQILSMNLITFGLPTLAVALQEPEHRNLASLAREGTTALEKPLRRDVMRRAVATAMPSLAAYVLALPLGQMQARTVAFGTAIGSQLLQTLASGQVETGLTKSVMSAVGASLALMLGSMLLPQSRSLLTLALPSLPAWALIAAASICAPIVAQALSASERVQVRRALPALASRQPHRRGSRQGSAPVDHVEQEPCDDADHIARKDRSHKSK